MILYGHVIEVCMTYTHLDTNGEKRLGKIDYNAGIGGLMFFRLLNVF